MRIVLCLLTVGWLYSCQPKESSPNDIPPVSDATAEVAGTITPTHSSITQETMNMLWEKCTQIDYIFYTLPYSISTNSNAESRQLLRHISTDAAQMLPNCKAIATIVYNGNGEKLLEAALYLSESPCSYIVFYENQKPKYANYLTQEGIDYMRQLFNSVQVQ